MKLLKSALLMLVLGVPLMGGNCGGEVKEKEAKCAKMIDKDACNQIAHQCKWKPNYKPESPATCTGTATKCPDISEDSNNSALHQFCQDTGCRVEKNSWTFGGLLAAYYCKSEPSTPLKCPSQFDGAAVSEDKCDSTGCTYTAAVEKETVEDGGICIDNF
jgi:hypothetical protein